MLCVAYSTCINLVPSIYNPFPQQVLVFFGKGLPINSNTDASAGPGQGDGSQRYPEVDGDCGTAAL